MKLNVFVKPNEQSGLHSYFERNGGSLATATANALYGWKAVEWQRLHILRTWTERFGKVGTPEREAFRKEAYAYCVGQIISDARKREKVTQQELAQRVGTNKSYISRIENGSVEPGAGMFLRILSALGLRFEVSQPLAFG